MLGLHTPIPELLPVQEVQKQQASIFISAVSTVVEQTSEKGLIPKCMMKLADTSCKKFLSSSTLT
jgi:hypothetical protein